MTAFYVSGDKPSLQSAGNKGDREEGKCPCSLRGKEDSNHSMAELSGVSFPGATEKATKSQAQ